jgi:hypothetical protein
MSQNQTKYLLTPDQHRRRARRLRQWPQHSLAAELHELAANMQERLAKARDNVGSYWQPNVPAITPLRDTAR